MPGSLRLPFLLALLVSGAATTELPEAQRTRPAGCPWCEKGDPTALGVVGHGPMPLLSADSEAFSKTCSESDWMFLETTHFRFASSLGAQRLSAKDLKRLKADLARLHEAFPSMPKRVRKLDPWLRLHWMAMRLEDFYARFQKLLCVTDADFPESRGDGPFMGDGCYLGEKEKFEVLLHENRGTHFRTTSGSSGVKATDSMRWHHRSPHKMVLSVPAVDSDLRQDRWLLPHLVHNLSHVFLAAYKHFSYHPPVWIDEGLALAMEREVEPESWTREGEEGTYQERGRSKPWDQEVERLVKKSKAPSLASLMRKHTLGELETSDHVAIWSICCFLLEEHPEKLAVFLGGVKGQLDERGYPSGKNLPELQRRLLRELWDWSPNDLDAAWRESVLGVRHVR